MTADQPTSTASIEPSETETQVEREIGHLIMDVLTTGGPYGYGSSYAEAARVVLTYLNLAERDQRMRDKGAREALAEVEADAAPPDLGSHGYVLREPRRGLPGVSCTRCMAEIEAVAVIDPWGVVINGTHSYDWRHVDSVRRSCRVQPPTARPYDGWNAQSRLDAAEREARAVDDA